MNDAESNLGTDACSAYSAMSSGFIGGLLERNRGAIEQVGDLLLETIRENHLIYAAGAGHSIGGVIEMFFRAGGLPAVYPLWDPGVLPLNGASASTEAERTEGLGRGVVESSPIADGDVLFVFSNSGINYYPVEVAAAGKAAGATVVAVTSARASSGSPLREGHRLMDVADVVIDTDAPPGDLSWPPEGPVVAPLSSLAVAQIWNLIMVYMISKDPSLRTWQSANAMGGGAGNESLAETYRRRIPAM